MPLLPRLAQAALVASLAASARPARAEEPAPPRPAEPGSPALVATRTISLDEARRLADERSLQRQELALALEQARSVANSADAFLYPSVSATGQVTFNDHESVVRYDIPEVPGISEGGSVEQVFTPQWDYRASVTVSQTLFNARAFPGLRFAERLADVAEQDEAVARFALLQTVDDLYFAALAQQRAVEAGRRNVALVRVEADRADRELAGGSGSRYASTRAHTRLRAAEREVAVTEQAHRRSIVALASVLRVDADFDVAVPGELPAPPGRQQLAEQAALARPELAQAREQAASQAARIDEARGRLWPTLVAQLQGNLAQTTAVSDEAFRWNLALILEWNLFDGGLRAAEVEQRRLAQRQAEVRSQRVAEQVVAELDQAWTTWERSSALLAASREEAQLARETLDMTEESLRRGVTTQLDVDAAQAQLHVAELAIEVADTERLAALNALYRLAGAITPAAAR
jgi:outer membrane protein TolC